MTTLGERLVEWLEVYGVDTVFGIPGVHTVEMYRGLAGSGVRHVTPRHEQGAGFMADGYYRATGRVAAAFVITGPGLTNILTPMAQAYADSIPMLVVSSVNRRRTLGLGTGDLHEVQNQALISAQAAAFSHRLTDVEQLGDVLAQAWAVFEGARPRPVHIEVPLDMFSDPAPAPTRRAPRPVAMVPGDLDAAVAALQAAERPLILAGGGAPGAALTPLAETLKAPVVMTSNGRGALVQGHALGVPASPSLQSIRAGIADADVVLAVGTEIGRTDYDMYDRSAVYVPGTLIRIDNDPRQMVRNALPDIALPGDAGATMAALLAQLTAKPGEAGAERAAILRAASWEEIGPKYRTTVEFVNLIRDTLADVPIVTDSTQAAYAGNMWYDAGGPAHWFGAATGYGALGYGLPGAVGAAVGRDGPVVCIAGDGGFQFTLSDLGTAVEERLPLILIVWNNRGYGEIKDYMISRQITPVGVDLATPDFVALGRAYGAEAIALDSLPAVPGLLRQAAARPGPTVIEVDEALVLGTI